jgi:integrase
MSITKITSKDGTTRWASRGRVGGRGSRSFNKRFLRKEDAVRWDTEQTRKKQLGGLVMSSDMTLDEYGVGWWKRAVQELAVSTARNYEGVLGRHVLPRLGSVRLSDLTPPVVSRFQSELRSAEVGKATIRLAMSVLSAICRDAVERGEMVANPVQAVKKLSAPRVRKVVCLAPVSVESLRFEMPTTADALLISVLAYAGLRPGEALALTWGDVGEGTLRVDKSLSFGEEKETKTRKNRSVRILKPLAEDLRAARLALGRIPYGSERIFARSDGGAWTDWDYRNWRRRVFKEAVKRAKLSPSLRPYDLRHSFCSLLIAEGQSAVEVAAQAGHSPRVTLDTYAHVMGEVLDGEFKDAATAIQEARVSPVRHLSPGKQEDEEQTAKVEASPT